MAALSALSLDERVALADALRAHRHATAAAVTEEFLSRHPDWLARYGELARVRGIEDAGYHVDFLSGAVESGEAEAFASYARWTAGVLAARGIAPHFLAENLDQVGRALAQRLPPGGGEAVSELVRAGIEACSTAAHDLTAPPPTALAGSSLAPAQSVFLQALLQGDRRAATTVALEALRDGHPLGDVYEGLFQDALYEVGRRWQANQISVAQEHLATATAQYALAQVYSRVERPPVMRGRGVITGVQGEMHQMGANIVADALEADGWDVRFLGTNMPHEGILRVVAEHGAAVLGISATMLFNLPHVRRLIQDVRQRAASGGGAAPKIVVGGGAFRSAPDLWREIGADGFATGVREAVTLVRQWSAETDAAGDASDSAGGAGGLGGSP